MTSLSVAPPPRDQRAGIRPVPIMISLILALIPVQLDALVAATALPSIAGDLGAFDKIAWITTSYLLAMAIGTMASGRLGDMFGRRPAMFVALGLFLLGSLGSGLAPGMTALVAARAVQGLGAGCAFTTLAATIAQIAPPEKRARYQGVVAAVAPVSMILGPWIGGVINDHLGWRWIFLLNVPIVGLALIGVALFIRLPKTPRDGTVDVAGLVAASAMSIGLVLAGTWAGSRYAWTSPQVLGAAALAVAGLVTLVVVERRASRPILPLDLFTRRSVVACFVVMALGMGAVMMTTINFLPIFMQVVQHRSAGHSGLLLLPMLLPAIAVAMLIGGWTTRGSRFRIVMVAGTTVLTAGMICLATLDAGTSALTTGVAMLLTGVGVGMLFQTPLVLVQNSVAAREVGAATGAANFFRMVGGSLGVGALGAAFTARLGAAAGGGSSSLDLSSLDPNRLASLPAATRHMVEHAVTSANSLLFTIAAVLAVVALAAALCAGRPTQHDDA